MQKTMKYIYQIGLLLFLYNSAIAQQTEKVSPEYYKLRDSFYMVTIGFTNIGVLVGEKELLFVDASTRELMASYRDSLLTKFGNKPVKYILNTHSHWDHTGGNPAFMKTGTVCISHEKAKEKMIETYYVDAEGRSVKDPAKGKAKRDFEENELPTITFTDTMLIDFGSEDILLFHVEEAHTVGDAIIYFKKNNVIAMGDNYFGNAYTFGKNIEGMIKVHEQVLNFIDDKTVILPGHGIPSDKTELQLYLTMLKDVKSKIEIAKKNGKTLEEVKADKSITDQYDEKYGKLYFDGERFRALIYNGGN